MVGELDFQGAKEDESQRYMLLRGNKKGREREEEVLVMTRILR